MCHVLKTPSSERKERCSLSSSSKKRKQKLPPAQHSQGRNPVGLISHEVICGPRPLHIDMAYYDWLDFSWVPSPEFTEVDIFLEGGVIERLSPYSELWIPTGLCLNCESHLSCMS